MHILGMTSKLRQTYEGIRTSVFNRFMNFFMNEHWTNRVSWEKIQFLNFYVMKLGKNSILEVF